MNNDTIQPLLQPIRPAPAPPALRRARRIQWPIIAVCCIGAAGCVATPPTTPSLTALAPSALGLVAMSAPKAGPAWWEAFGDAQLDRLVDQALAGSPTLAGALARVRIAQSELARTRAQSYPRVDFDAAETRERFSNAYIIPPPYGGTTQWIGTIQGNLNWDLDFWGRQAAMVAQARASVTAAALDAEAARLALSGAVTQTYVALGSAYALSDVAADAVRQRRSILMLTSQRFDKGLENAAARKQAEALLANAEQVLTDADSNRDLAVHALAALIGRGADAYGQIVRPSLDLNAALPLPDKLPADLLGRRPDVLAAQARIEAALSGRKVARTAFYPDVNLTALAGWAAIGLAPLFTGRSLNYGVGGAVHLPIFDAGKLRAEYAGATAQLDEAVASYNAAVVGAVKETADALSQSRSLQAEAGEVADARTAAQSGFDIAAARYRRGLSPQTAVLDVEDTLLTARRQQALLASQAANARVSLLLAVGGGFTPKDIAADEATVPVRDQTP
ncbi:MAG: efflux transporter outer membrane subunit [Caulobacteraceae bacterium]